MELTKDKKYQIVKEGCKLWVRKLKDKAVVYPNEYESEYYKLELEEGEIIEFIGIANLPQIMKSRSVHYFKLIRLNIEYFGEFLPLLSYFETEKIDINDYLIESDYVFCQLDENISRGCIGIINHLLSNYKDYSISESNRDILEKSREMFNILPKIPEQDSSFGITISEKRLESNCFETKNWHINLNSNAFEVSDDVSVYEKDFGSDHSVNFSYSLFKDSENIMKGDFNDWMYSLKCLLDNMNHPELNINIYSE